jgi:hypothetical protein
MKCPECGLEMENRSDAKATYWPAELLYTCGVPIDISTKGNSAWLCKTCMAVPSKPGFYAYLPESRRLYSWFDRSWNYVKTLSIRKCDSKKIIGGVFRQ